MARDHTPLVRPYCRELSPVLRQHSRSGQKPSPVPSPVAARCASPGPVPSPVAVCSASPGLSVTTVSSCQRGVYGYSTSLPNPTAQASGHVHVETSSNVRENVTAAPHRAPRTHRPPSIIRSPSARSFERVSGSVNLGPARQQCTETSPIVNSRRVDIGSASSIPVPLKAVSSATVLRANKVTGIPATLMMPRNDRKSPSAQNGNVKDSIPQSRTTKFSEAQRRRTSKLVEQEIEQDSPPLTPRSCGTLPPDRPLNEEEVAVVAEATAKALSVTALQQALARVEKLEEGLLEEANRNKVLTEKCEATLTREQELEERLKVEANRNEEFMAKCAEELLEARQLNEHLKSLCENQKGKLDCALKDCAALENKVAKLSSDNDNLTSIINKILRRSDLTSEDIVGLAQAQDVQWPSTKVFVDGAHWPSTKVFVDGEVTIGHEDTDICP